MLIISSKAVLEAVDKRAYTLARSLPAEVTDETKALIMDIAQEPHRAEVNDYINTAVSEISEMLAAYNRLEMYPYEVEDNDGDDMQEYRLMLTLPSTFQLGAMAAIKRHAMNYVVCSVLRSWTSYAYPPAAERFLASANAAYEHITNLAKGRTRFPRVSPSPF